MSSSTIASRLSATALLAALLTTAACGSQTAADLGPSAPGAGPSVGPEGQSSRAIDADARRAAQGQVPTPSPGQPGKRLPDARP